MRNKIILILTSIIICISLYNMYNVFSLKEFLFKKIDQSETCINNKDFNKAEELSKQMIQTLKDKEKALKLFCRRNHIEEIADILAELPSYAKQKNISMYLAMLNKLRGRVDHLWTSEIPSYDTLM